MAARRSKFMSLSDAVNKVINDLDSDDNDLYDDSGSDDSDEGEETLFPTVVNESRGEGGWYCGRGRGSRTGRRGGHGTEF